MIYILSVLSVIGIVGILDVLFFKGLIGVTISEFLFGGK